MPGTAIMHYYQVLHNRSTTSVYNRNGRTAEAKRTAFIEGNGKAIVIRGGRTA